MDKKRGEEFKKNTLSLRYGMNPGEEAAEVLGEDEKYSGLLSVGELAKFARVSRSALIY